MDVVDASINAVVVIGGGSVLWRLIRARIDGLDRRLEQLEDRIESSSTGSVPM